MNHRTLCIQGITPEQLKHLLTKVQWLCLRETREFLIDYEVDWYIILRVLCDQGVIVHQNRVPYAAFLRWIVENEVPVYRSLPSEKQLRYLAKRASDTQYPWQSKNDRISSNGKRTKRPVPSPNCSCIPATEPAH
jgi:hypothetical protein